MAVNPKLTISAGIQHVYDMNYLYGFCSAAIIYYTLSKAFPATETLLEVPIYEDVTIHNGIEVVNDGTQIFEGGITEKDGKYPSVEAARAGSNEDIS